MDNASLAARLARIADLLEANRKNPANPWRIKAYRRAARSLERHERSVADMLRQGEPLTSIPGIGAELGRLLEELATTEPSKAHEKYSLYTHSAVFAEVRVDEDLGSVTVPRVVSAVAGGRVLNPKTARSQIMGSIVWGIGMALQEESVLDHVVGRFMTHNLADYHFSVHADVHDIDVIFVDERDDIVNPLGAKGLGEIGLVGVGAAIANAVYHATGKRVRDLPITLDKLL